MYQSLYRKYRPKSFDEVVGQNVIVQTLKNSVKNNKLSHAYLFTGPRGTGKTSIAKILAKLVNCESLENIIIPGSVKRIYTNAFASCKNLKNVTFNEGLESIFDNSFLGCFSLEHITLPKSIKGIGLYAFISSLKSVKLPVEFGEGKRRSERGYLSFAQYITLIEY